ncbi:hypothetical protein GCM10008171_33020 [Methylopila jiangsuensis]|uniref:Uncharacterized protein n=1 Tax=Methylopila jiangsuensis TaxID=586230 RepID=A0A9W6JKV8_9HYPH|nr:hypothetical protein [Methylopila jiangsuensis]MDR6284564.1 hypothetical protein [Methylopila jiangsuensis]GLK78048.1 hypothetical protein GCM10008171_33020 [Methylopila jiangsuensis]
MANHDSTTEEHDAPQPSRRGFFGHIAGAAFAGGVVYLTSGAPETVSEVFRAFAARLAEAEARHEVAVRASVAAETAYYASRPVRIEVGNNESLPFDEMVRDRHRRQREANVSHFQRDRAARARCDLDGCHRRQAEIITEIDGILGDLVKTPARTVDDLRLKAQLVLDRDQELAAEVLEEFLTLVA